MINGLEGIPGSGKSYEAVVYHVLPMLEKGRLVITNLPLLVDLFAAINPAYRDLIELRTRSQRVLGLWDVSRVDKDGNGQAFLLDDLSLHNQVEVVPVKIVIDQFSRASRAAVKNDTIFGGVWDYYSTWKHPVSGQGPVFLIDECHDALPTSGTDSEVIEWFKLHRHFNCDVLLITQNFRDMNQPIARLIAMLVKVRKADILGKPDCYIRKVHSGYRGAVISTEERKYKPEFFALYKSHSQGNAVSESAAGDVKPFIVKFKRFSRVFYVITALYCVYAIYRYVYPPNKSPVAIAGKPVSALSSSGTSGLVGVGAPAVVAASVPAVASSSGMVSFSEDEIPEPFATKGLHLTGVMRTPGRVIYMFAISNSSVSIGQITSDDLVKVGYRWQPLTDCVGTLRWKTLAKSVICDAPVVAEGSHNNPVVLALPAGSVVPVSRSDNLRGFAS